MYLPKENYGAFPRFDHRYSLWQRPRMGELPDMSSPITWWYPGYLPWIGVIYGWYSFRLSMEIPSHISPWKLPKWIYGPGIPHSLGMRYSFLSRKSWPSPISGPATNPQKSIWWFPKMEVPLNGWFIRDNSIKMDDLGVPLFQEIPIFWPWNSWWNISHNIDLYPTTQVSTHV